MKKFAVCILQFAIALAAHAVEFRNPLFHMDFSDPDLCTGGDGRVYMTASTFGGLPGLPILATSDMVNWDYVGYALEKHPYPEGVESPEHGKSVYAPSIRYRAATKEYVIYWGDPDHGIYRVAAKNPAGPWSEPRCIVEGSGMIDVCPLYDDDGRVYIVNGWAGSRVGINNQLTIRELDADETRAISDPVVVFDGGKANHIVCEGPKLYKKDGEYWLWFPAGGVGPGYQVAARAKSIWGPYEDKIVLKRGSTQINGPHQGGVVYFGNGERVTGNGGDWWFVHFSDRGAYGRISYLEPMKWPQGDWPQVGNNGEPAEKFEVPLAKEQKPFGGLPTSDEFDSPKRGLQWFFLGRSAQQFAWATTYGVFRMFTTYTEKPLWETPNTMVQRFPALSFTATMKARVAGRRRGDEFGLIVTGGQNARIGLRLGQKNGASWYDVVYTVGTQGDKHNPGTTEEETIVGRIDANAESPATDIYFRVEVRPGKAHPGKPLAPPPWCTFSYSTDGENWTKVDQAFRATPGGWIGAMVGFYAIGNGNRPGVMDVDCFRFSE